MPCSSAAKDSVMPAKADIQSRLFRPGLALDPAFTWMTRAGVEDPDTPPMLDPSRPSL